MNIASNNNIASSSATGRPPLSSPKKNKNHKMTKYKSFIEAYKSANIDGNAWNEKEHKKAQSTWKELKEKAKEDPDLIDKQINDYKIKAAEKQSRKLKQWKGFTSATSSSSRLNKKV